MKHNSRLRMGPAPAPAAAPTATATKFWNVAAVGDDEAEITLHGDVMSRQPTDWWTGEPEPGLYITPQLFSLTVMCPLSLTAARSSMKPSGVM